MRHVLGAMLVTLAAAALCGCSERQGDAKADEGGEGKLTIAVSIPAADHGWTAGVGYWARQAMDKHPEVNWVHATASSAEKQIADIEDMMSQQKLDALVILCFESAPLTPIAEEVKDNGIYIVNVDRGFLKPIADVFLEGDNRAFGRKSAEFMVEKLGTEEQKNIVILRGRPSTVDTDRYEAAMEVFNRHPNINVLGTQPGYWDRQKGMKVMQAFLTNYNDIDAVWAQDDDMAEGAEQAIREKGRAGRMWMLGGAGKKTIVKRVMEGDPMYPGDITYPPAMIAAGIHTCVYKLGGCDEKKLRRLIPEHLGVDLDQVTGDTRHIKLDVHLITPENAEKFYFPDSPF